MDFSYEEAKAYLFDIPRFTSKNIPQATGDFLEVIGDLSLTIPTVHVAGTNGKGSVCAYLRAGLNACGLTCGVFTSPHLVSVRERFMLDGEMISREDFVVCFSRVMEAVEEIRRREEYKEYHPTFFEFLFFMAMVWYSQKKPDVLILETGLGGRLDATNSIESPKVCIITEIGFDHMEYLGNTKALIAGEKAGIIKKQVPVVFCDKTCETTEVILKVACEKDAEAFALSEKNLNNLETNSSGIDFSLQSLYDNYAKISLNTKAHYQAENSSLAYRAIELLKRDVFGSIDLQAVRSGFLNMVWPGRMEEIEKGLIVDGAHNEDGIKAFLETVSHDDASERFLIYSAVGDKQIETVVKLISESGLFKRVYIAKLESYRAASVERIRAAFESAKNGPLIAECKDVAECLEMSKGDVGASTVRYVAGSLYLVGEVKALFLKEEE